MMAETNYSLADNPWVPVALGLALIMITLNYMTPFMDIASVNFFLLLTGFTLRHRSRRLHAALMSLGIASDLGLVVTLQIRRHAVQTALAFKLSPLNQAHIFFSLAATLLYPAMIGMGLRLLLKGRGSGRLLTVHRWLGALTLTFRTLGYFLMFSMIK